MGGRKIKRRGLLGGAAPFLGGVDHGGGEAGTQVRPVAVVASALPGRTSSPAFQAEAFNMVGVFDVDWLLDARFGRLLDNLAASPGAFGAVRFFGALNSGEKEDVFPKGSGGVWRRPDERPDFSVTLRAIEVLTSRRLVPFVCLNFFPSAVSPSPIQPPAAFAAWQELVQAFLDQSVQRFGAAEVARWWLEVWNEPNMPPFWSGSFEQYLDLYRATSDAVVRSGHAVRIGGPAVAYMPDEGEGLIERFLGFLHREPAVRCDFISFHRKGIWVRQEARPELERSVAAARATSRAALRLDPDRFRGLPIINNEADMKVGFDTPFEPRMTEQFPSWLTAQMVAYDQLSTEHAAAGLRFWAASDNANQQLIRAPFDGRRSIMTRLGAADDLAKVPAYGFYELLRLLHGQHGRVLTPDSVYPRSDLYHLATTGADAIAAVFTVYPSDGAATPGERRVEYRLRDVPWARVNVARFCIDAEASNAYSAAGRTMPATIDASATRHIRLAQEIAVLEPIRSGIATTRGTLHETFRLRAFSTVLIWVTPFSAAEPSAPRWLETEMSGANVILRWTPSSEVWFYSYEVLRLSVGEHPLLLTPVPLRAATWVDTPPPGKHTYQLCAISASGARSRPVASPPFEAKP